VCVRVCVSHRAKQRNRYCYEKRHFLIRKVEVKNVSYFVAHICTCYPCFQFTQYHIWIFHKTKILDLTIQLAFLASLLEFYGTIYFYRALWCIPNSILQIPKASLIILIIPKGFFFVIADSANIFFKLETFFDGKNSPLLKGTQNWTNISNSMSI